MAAQYAAQEVEARRMRKFAFLILGRDPVGGFGYILA